MASVTADVSITMTAQNLTDLAEVYDRLNNLNATYHNNVYSIVKDDGALTITINGNDIPKEA